MCLFSSVINGRGSNHGNDLEGGGGNFRPGSPIGGWGVGYKHALGCSLLRLPRPPIGEHAQKINIEMVAYKSARTNSMLPSNNH